MAVVLSSDILIGVLRAGSPDRALAAAGTLRGSAGKDAQFEGVLTELRPLSKTKAHLDLIESVLSAVRPADGTAVAGHVARPSRGRQDSPEAVASLGLEATLIRSLLEVMLPRVEAGSLGGSFAGGAWRSMAIDEMSSLYASSGGLGLAQDIFESLDQPERYSPELAGAGWPTFETGSIGSYIG